MLNIFLAAYFNDNVEFLQRNIQVTGIFFQF